MYKTNRCFLSSELHTHFYLSIKRGRTLRFEKPSCNFLTYQVCFLCFLSYFSILFVSQLRIESRPIRQNDVHSSLRGFRFFSIQLNFTEGMKFLQSLQYISMQTLCTQKCTLVHCQTNLRRTRCPLSNFHKLILRTYAYVSF